MTTDPFETALKALLSDGLADYVDVDCDDRSTLYALLGNAVIGRGARVTVTGRVPDAEKRLVVSMKPARVVLLWRDAPLDKAREYEPRMVDIHTATDKIAAMLAPPPSDAFTRWALAEIAKQPDPAADPRAAAFARVFADDQLPDPYARRQ
jgi:hypothetical protein